MVAKAKIRYSQHEMRRFNNLFEKIIDIDNIILADKKARINKTNSYGVRIFDKNRESNLLDIQQRLEIGKYKTGEYHIFKIYEPKERNIARLDYEHRVVHHAIMNILEQIWVSIFTKNTYACIKGRGIHKCLSDLKIALKDTENTKYCLKIDVSKFYPSIDRDILKNILRRKIKDVRLLKLFDEIIDSAPTEQGVPIGNYLSQFFANLYLAYFDHWIKEDLDIKYYYRYCDDMVFLSSDKNQLHGLLIQVNDYLENNLNLSVKRNYQVFPVEKRGIDFVGYKIFHTHVLLRKSIKKNFAKKRKNQTFINSYMGWAKHCNSKNLIYKLLNS